MFTGLATLLPPSISSYTTFEPSQLVMQKQKMKYKTQALESRLKKQKEDEKKQVLYTQRNFPLKLVAKSTSSGSFDIKHFPEQCWKGAREESSS